MKVIVDTSVWSLAFRRKAVVKTAEVVDLVRVVEEGLVVLLGPVRQEVLSGIKHREQFDRLRERLAAFPDLELKTRDFETAAELCNLWIAKGVQASHTDFLIAAAAIIRGYAVLSADQDFMNIARIVPVRTYGQR
ncbi:MAG: PIN domain-containing protein [Akkermansiaceae bacterium]|nr:PIN domain-containing protein [Akkermansiaceae bacterium]MCF7734044.1 PIN domain-containing protein [Akkermansiaceae bacterium]